MKLEHGIALHDTLGRGFGRREGQVVETGFRRWVSGVIASFLLPKGEFAALRMQLENPFHGNKMIIAMCKISPLLRRRAARC